LATVVVVLNWILVACGTISAVGYLTYNVDDSTIVQEIYEIYTKIFGANVEVEKAMTSLEARMIWNVSRIAFGIVFHTLMTAMLTFALMKAESRISYLTLWIIFNLLAVSMNMLYFAGDFFFNIPTDMTEFAWKALDFFEMMWMIVSTYIIVYYRTRLCEEAALTQLNEKYEDNCNI